MPWGHAHAAARAALPWAPEMALLPGFTLIGLAVAGLVFSIWTLRQRLLLPVGVVVSLLFPMGRWGPAEGAHTDHLPLHGLPGLQGLPPNGRVAVVAAPL